MFKKLPKQKVIILEEIFRESRYPNLDERRKLAERLDISESKVKVSFFNIRSQYPSFLILHLNNTLFFLHFIELVSE